MSIFSRLMGCTAAAVVSLALAPGAFAQTSTNDSLTNGVYFGSGNQNGNFAITNFDFGGGASIELGLRADIRFGGPAATYGNYYSAPTGTSAGGACDTITCGTWNFVFSVNTTGVDVADLSSLVLTVSDGVQAQTISIDPRMIGDNATLGALGIQNSENPGFFAGDTNSLNPLLNPLFSFDPNAAVTYTVTLAATYDSQTATDQIIVDVPEPASMALLGVGIAGLGWMRRRRRG